MADIDHEIFRIFRSGLHFENVKVKDLIDVKNSILYLFDLSTGDILVANSISFTGLFDSSERYQVFEPRIRIFGKARALRASENNVRVAVITELGLYVVDLPHIWTCLMLPPTSNHYTTCEVWMVAPEVERMPRVFVYEVLQARWHPRQHNHLLALYNDNFLRLLDTESHTLLQALALGRHPNSSISTLIPLHEHTVDFDFAPLVRKSEEVTSRVEAPVLLLSGTGDVSCAVITREKTRIDEPMCFKADKKSNPQIFMSSDMIACSLIVLPCYPTVVVISSNTGVVSHCTLLGEGVNQYLQIFEEYNLHGEEFGRHGTYLLLKDPGSMYRYFVLHAAGVHAVMLPLIPILEHFLTQEFGEDIEEKLRAAVRETESIVRHLVNTQVAEVTDPRPPFGVGMIPVRVTKSKVLVLLADCQATVHPVDSVFPPVSDYLNRPFPTVKETRKQFSAVIGNYLLGSKSSRPPMLKVGDALKNASPERTLQFLRTYFNNLKEDRIKKHTVVAELIDAKVRDILIEYDCQRKQLEKLKSARESLQQNAERIAEQYEETNEKHMELQKRLEMIGLRINAPGRSVSEEKMRTELGAMKQKTEKLHFALLQAQALFEHRKSQEQNPNAQEIQRKPLYLSETRRKGIKQSLVTMSESIQDMKDRINRLNTKLSFIN